MFACCNLGYGQYLDADGTLDVDAFWAAVAEQKSQIAKMQNAKKREHLRMMNDRDGFDPATACRCPCHTKGSHIMH